MTNTYDLNFINRLFYTSCPEAFTSSGLADFLVTTPQIQEAIRLEIESLVPTSKISLFELCSGARPDRWQHFSSSTTQRFWDVTLSDISASALPPPNSSPQHPNFSFRQKIQSLFDPLPNSNYDVILTSYGFDSVWLPQDVHYMKFGNVWYKVITEINVPSNFPTAPHPKDFSQITITEQHITVDILSEPFGSEINSYYSAIPQIEFNLPGGLIQIVTSAFSNNLSPRGIFISLDIAASTPAKISPIYQRSGRVAMFKKDDYGFAKYVLSRRGFIVSLQNLSDLLEKHNFAFPMDLSDHVFLTIQH